jgi:thiol-disulfide isomerase/thioredoxin
MNGDGLMIVQLAVMALMATVLLVVWGDLGGFSFVKTLPSGVKFAVGLLAMFGMVGAVAAPNYMKNTGQLSKGQGLNLDWPLVSLSDGKEVNLSSFKGKVLFINLWATWCGPCVQEMPSIERLYRDFANRDDVAFLLISHDRSPDLAKRFADSKGLKAPVYYPKAQPPESFQADGIPVTIIVRKDGTQELRHDGFKDWSTSDGLLNDLAKRPTPGETSDPTLAKETKR